MIVNMQEDILRLQHYEVLDELLMDKTTGGRILWATDAYEHLGAEFRRDHTIDGGSIMWHAEWIMQARVGKAAEEQAQRQKKKAEVFTPLWICRKMNDYADEVWFGREHVFFNGEEPTEGPIQFAAQGPLKQKSWQGYVKSTRLEITCGEAPFLVSRYDAATGEVVPIPKRVGLLDRKLRVVNENTETEADWRKWARVAFESVYGYEYQGDSLLIARVNLMQTFIECYLARWGEVPDRKEIKKIANVIVWNLWQMDGLTGRVPLAGIQEQQAGIYQKDQEALPLCRIKDWRSWRSLRYVDVNKKHEEGEQLEI